MKVPTKMLIGVSVLMAAFVPGCDAFATSLPRTKNKSARVQTKKEQISFEFDACSACKASECGVTEVVLTQESELALIQFDDDFAQLVEVDQGHTLDLAHVVVDIADFSCQSSCKKAGAGACVSKNQINYDKGQKDDEGQKLSDKCGSCLQACECLCRVPDAYTDFYCAHEFCSIQHVTYDYGKKLGAIGNKEKCLNQCSGCKIERLCSSIFEKSSCRKAT